MKLTSETVRMEKSELDRIYEAIAALDRLLTSVEADANNVQLDIGRLRRRHRQVFAFVNNRTVFPDEPIEPVL